MIRQFSIVIFYYKYNHVISYDDVLNTTSNVLPVVEFWMTIYIMWKLAKTVIGGNTREWPDVKPSLYKIGIDVVILPLYKPGSRCCVCIAVTLKQGRRGRLERDLRE